MPTTSPTVPVVSIPLGENGSTNASMQRNRWS